MKSEQLKEVEVVEIDSEYDDFINKLIKESSELTVPNSSESHALSILRAVFENAKDSVSLYSDKLNRRVYNDVVLNKILTDFLSVSTKKLKVLVRDGIDGDDENCFYQTIKHNNRVEIKKLDKDNFLLTDPPFYNFVVSDNKMFRLEVDAKNANAYCNFNNPDMATRLAKIFEHSFNSHVAILK